MPNEIEIARAKRTALDRLTEGCVAQGRLELIRDTMTQLTLHPHWGLRELVDWMSGESERIAEAVCAPHGSEGGDDAA